MDAFLGPYVMDWLHLAARWVHVTAAIAWVGASFYFIALDYSLRPPKGDRAAGEGVGGESWEIHGGGFYRIEKFRVAPARLPESLRWFKWEAYVTWLSGFSLLVLLYYADAESYLIDPAVAALAPWQAVGASLALLALGWLAYDALARRLGHRDSLLAVAIGLLIVAATWGSSQLFSPRAAYVQVGSMLGTWMAANVFFVIIPGQRELVAAKKAGREPDPMYGVRGKQRSVHNNYLTLPALFAMISQHFPFTYGHEQGWLVLLALTAVGAAVQHFFNLRQQGRTPWGIAIAAFAAMLLVGVATFPRSRIDGGLSPADIPAVQAVIAQHCLSCHAARPTAAEFATAPKGVRFDTSQQIRAQARRIYQQVVLTRAMPLGNVTGMTDDERDLIGRWFRSGAPLP